MADIVPIDVADIPKRSRPAPTWMRELIEQVCADAGKPVPATIGYQRSKYPNYSSGRTWYHDGGRIHMRVGDAVERSVQRMIVLHELAHHLLGPGQHHNDRFWTLAFMLYYRYGGVDMKYAVERETRYRKSAAHGYRNATALLGREQT